MKGPKTTKAIKTVRAVAPLAETPPEKAEAGRAMAQVEEIEERDEIAAMETEGRLREEKRAADAARIEALACEHRIDLSEEGFNEALKKVGRQTR